MIAGAPDDPREVRPGSQDYRPHMTDKTKRGEKRGVLSTGRAKQLDKTKDADADAADEDESDEG